MIERLLADVAGRQRRATRIAMTLAVLAAFAGVGLLALSGWFLTGAAIAGASGMAAARAFNYLLPSAGIRALAILRTLSRYGERLFGHRAALFTLADLRPALFARLASADPCEALAQSGGKVANQLGSDVDALENSVVHRITLPGAVAAAITGLLAAALAGPLATLALFCGLAAMRLSARTLTPRLLGAASRQQADALERLQSGYTDYAACSAEIAVYGLVPDVTNALAPHMQELEEARLTVVRAEALIHGLQLALAALTIAAVLALAGGNAPLTALAALAGTAAADGWSALARSDMQQVQARDAIDRLENLAALSPRSTASADTETLAAAPLHIKAGTSEITVQPGTRLLITGPSGVGKSCLIGTLLGLRADALERLFIGQNDVCELGLEALRPLFACAPQDASLIAGTVADNLRLARPGVTEAEMWSALTTACLADTVRNLPDGLNQWLGGDGARLSGGQRKRLSLARALLARRPWLVLDEPSEGLDSATEQQLAENLQLWLDHTGAGLILVSHREGLHSLAQDTLELTPD